jgi:hypothetical protein
MNRVEVLLEPVRLSLEQIGVFLPRLLVAIAVLLLGWLLAKTVRFAIVKVLRAFNFHVLAERSGIDGFLRQGGVRADTVEIFGLLFFWLAILAALIVAFNSLGLAYVTDLLARIALFVPHLMIALLIFALGAYFARFVGRAVSSVSRGLGGQDAELLGRIARYAILVFVALIALDQVNVGGEIVRQTFLIVLAGVVFALALAFGLGGKDWAASLLERWWPRK